MNNEEFFYSPDDVKSIRKDTGLTQKEFCEKFGVNINTLRHWEKGDRIPNGSSLILLNLIAKSAKKICSILNNSEDNKVVNTVGKTLLKDVFNNRRYLNFDEFATSGEEHMEQAILVLLDANGFPYKELKKQGDNLSFYVGHDSTALREILNINTSTSLISGEFRDLIQKTYLMLLAIEQDLTDAIYWPREMRINETDKILHRIGVDKDFYSNILKNW